MKQPNLKTNIYNLDELKNFLSSLEIENPSVNKWLHSNLRKWMINNYPVKKQVPYRKGLSPEWAEKAAKNKTLYSLFLKGAYFRKFCAELQYALWYIEKCKNPSRVGVEQAIKEGKKYRNVEPIKQYIKLKHKNYTAYSISSRKDIAQEGKDFNNCMEFSSRVYSFAVASKKTKLFILRTAEKEPVACIEYCAKSKRINQVKGVGNKFVSKKHKYVISAFLNHIKDMYEVFNSEKEDTQRLGIVFYEGVFYTERNLPPRLYRKRLFVKENKFFAFSTKAGSFLAVQALLGKKPDTAAFFSPHVLASIMIGAYDKLKESFDRVCALESPHIPKRILNKAIYDEMPSVRAAAIRSSKVDAKLLKIGIKDKNLLVRREVILSKLATKELYDIGIKDRSFQVREAVIKKTCHLEHLNVGINDRHEKVRRATVMCKLVTVDHLKKAVLDVNPIIKGIAEHKLRTIVAIEHLRNK